MKRVNVSSELPLFDRPAEPIPPHARGSRTSLAAARHQRTTTGERITVSETNRRLVLAALLDSGERGATDEDIRTATGLDLNTVRPRRLELVRQGYARETALTRSSDKGHDMTVWALALGGRKYLQGLGLA
jgi:hypothetical protein